MVGRVGRGWKDEEKTAMNKEKKILFLIPLFFVIGCSLVWIFFPSLLLNTSWQGLWFRYSIGFVFSTLIGGVMTGYLVGNMQQEITDYIQKEYPGMSNERIRPFYWFSEVFGYVEIPMYTASYLLGKPEFIAVWLGVKILARWSLPRTEEDKITDSRHRYYPVLVGNLLGVVYGVAGALVIRWLECPFRFWSALAIMPALVFGTLSLTLYESHRYKKWLQDKKTRKG